LVQDSPNSRKKTYGFEVVVFNICCSAIFKEIYGLDVPAAMSLRNGSTFSNLLGYRNLNNIIDWLIKEDLITVKLGFKSKGKKAGIASKLRPTARFMELLSEFLLEPVIATTELVSIKDPDGSSSRGFKRELARTDEILGDLNKMIRSAQITVTKTIETATPKAIIDHLVSAKGFKPTVKGKEVNVTLHSEVVCFSRVYSGRVGIGGRLISGIQNLPRQERFSTQINGEETCELDFSSLHPNLCYALEGIEPPKDSYALTTVPREIAKSLLVTALNSKTRPSAIQSVRWEAIKAGKPITVDLEAAFDELEELHAPISRRFYSESWKYLQHLESCILLEVIAYFNAKDVICLGVHDSALVPTKYETELSEVMASKFKEITGANFSPAIDRKDV
jgi:hypothetical protein